MAQVLLPCFLPSWPAVKDRIETMAGEECRDVLDMIQLMKEIHDISNVGLEEIERPSAEDGHLFEDLQLFLTEELSADERQHFMATTVKRIARLAGRLKELRPPNGLRFSLQQQAGMTELSRSFIAALIANAFLSTFPNRNVSTHPTLQNFNFAHFFKGLRDSPLQKAKLRSLLHYFDWISEEQEANKEAIQVPLKITRKVMTGKQWLTIDDWKECIVPLAAIEIKHDLKIESSPADITQIIFVSPRIGGDVLGAEPDNTSTRESAQFTMCPELLVMLLNCEALEDNESLYVENCYQISRILPGKQRTFYECLETPRLLTFGCMDAENYTPLVVDQFEEDNFLRELNKAFLTFHPHMSEFVTVNDYMKDRRCRRNTEVTQPAPATRRLSPIGERSTPQSQILVDGASTSTPRSSLDTDSELVIQERPSWLSVRPREVQSNAGSGKFIVLGSSGECFPVNRPVKVGSPSVERFSSCDSESSEEFHSAQESVEDPDEEDQHFADKYLSKLYSPEKRYDFARRLREALNDHESMRTDSTEDSYDIGGISVKGPDVFDVDRIRIRRRGSGGFVLQEDSSFDEDLLQELILRSGGGGDGGGDKERMSHGDSSKYSFSTDLSSELSELQISSEELEMIPEDIRNKAVLHFATSILKRGFSESLVGCGEFPANENDNNIFPAIFCDVNNNSTKEDEKGRQHSSYNNNARSLSVEVVKQKHRLAAKLIGEILQKRSEPGEKKKTRIATGNWGCGRQAGDVQLKFILQWLAASLAGVKLTYHTAGHEKLSTLDTVCRILRDRKWSVGRLARSTLMSNQYFLENPAEFIIEGLDNKDFFDRLLGMGK